MDGPKPSTSLQGSYKFSLFTPAPVFLSYEDPNQLADDGSLGDWPQRLLHVPTMTSYEWQPGHKYGTYVKPRYNAISYTWGRYELRNPKEQPHVDPIKIHGVDWPIPRIDPCHFTTAQFQNLIHQSIELGPTTEDWINTSLDWSIEFVWLDIACINQMPDHPQKAMEIGRQAQIFRNAKRVHVWLNKSCQNDVEDAIENIEQGAAIALKDDGKIIPQDHQWTSLAGSKPQFLLNETKGWFASKVMNVKSKLRNLSPASTADTHKPQINLTGEEPWLTTALKSLEYLTQDPWFASLWTLQEAFICQWAYLIAEGAMPVHPKRPQLSSLFESCKTLLTICRNSIANKSLLGLEPAQAEVSFAKLVDKSGLGALADSNAMVLYTVASNRVVLTPEDSVYGIMQVFGFQLGVSAPDADIRAPIDLAQLELQLGKQLIKQFPLMSQMHVHTQPPARGHAWRVSKSSIAPELVSKLDLYVNNGLSYMHETLCQLSYQERDGCCWGSFSGHMCEFSKLASAWRSADHTMFGRSGKNFRSIHQIALDATDLIPDGVFSDTPQRDLPRDRRQHKFAAEIAKYAQCAELEVYVLLLGRYHDDQHDDEWWKLSGGPIAEFTGDIFNIGLILNRQDDGAKEIWLRLGICIWDIRHHEISKGRQERGILCGDGMEWKREVTGLFG